MTRPAYQRAREIASHHESCAVPSSISEATRPAPVVRPTTIGRRMRGNRRFEASPRSRLKKACSACWQAVSSCPGIGIGGPEPSQSVPHDAGMAIDSRRHATTRHATASAMRARKPAKIASLCWDRVIRNAVVISDRPFPPPDTP